MKILLINGSSRADGNSELLSNLVTENLTFTKIRLNNYKIKPINDLRHNSNGFQPVDDDFDLIFSEVLSNELLIFSTPIYWYSMSGIMKNFIDRFSHALRDSRYPNLKNELKSKKAILLAVGGDNPKIKGLPLIQQFQYTLDFLDISLSGYILGEGNEPGEILKDLVALSQAAALNRFIKNQDDEQN